MIKFLKNRLNAGGERERERADGKERGEGEREITPFP
jgi:hypothetical protein